MKSGLRAGTSFIPLRSAFFAILLALSLSACVDLKAEASIAADGSGRLMLDYRVPKSLESLDLYQDESAGLPIPLDRAVLDRRALSLPGIVLSSWSREDIKDEIRISAEVRFPSLPSLAQFLDPDGGRIRYTTAGAQRELQFTLASGTPVSKDAAAWSNLSYADYAVSISIVLPSRAVSASAGTLSASGTQALLTSPTSELLTRTDPLVWTIRW